MPKNSASNPRTSARNPPCREIVLPAAGTGEYQSSTSNLSRGISVTASAPRVIRSQNAATDPAPGKRQDIPATATSRDVSPAVARDLSDMEAWRCVTVPPRVQSVSKYNYVPGAKFSQHA